MILSTMYVNKRYYPERSFDMIRIDNHLGTIEMKNSYLTSLIGHTVTSCFGVVRMNPASVYQGAKSNILKKSSIDDGVVVRFPKGSDKMIIDLHISVTYGINVSAIVDSIINKVRYVVEKETGVEIKKINVYVDSMEA